MTFGSGWCLLFFNLLYYIYFSSIFLFRFYHLSPLLSQNLSAEKKAMVEKRGEGRGIWIPSPFSFNVLGLVFYRCLVFYLFFYLSFLLIPLDEFDDGEYLVSVILFVTRGFSTPAE